MSKFQSKYIPPPQPGSKNLSRPELSRLVSLKRKRGRREEGRFLAEGIRLLEEAVRLNRLPEQVFCYPPDISPRGEELLISLKSRGIAPLILSSRDFHRLADTENPQGIIGVFVQPSLKFELKVALKARRILIAEDINDPGNLGTMMRCALGFDFDLVILLGDCVEPGNPKLVRSTAGSVFGCRICQASLSDIANLQEKGAHQFLVADLSGEPEKTWLKEDTRGADSPRRGIALGIGSEGAGVSDSLLALASGRIRISHNQKLESLNAGVAAAIIMHTLYLRDLQK